MKNQDVVKNFFNRKTCKSSNNNLRVEAGYDNTLRLINYNTTLLQQNADGTLIYNATKYSVSTSCIQSYIRKELSGHYKTVDDVSRGTYTLR